MPSNSLGTVVEARPTSNPLDVIPDEMPFGVASLPLGMPVELEVIFEVAG